MTIEYRKGVAYLREIVTVEEAEGLLQWLAAHKQPKVDVSQCRHCHTAVLQVLMAARPTLAALPREETLAKWFEWAMTGEDHGKDGSGGR